MEKAPCASRVPAPCSAPRWWAGVQTCPSALGNSMLRRVGDKTERAGSPSHRLRDLAASSTTAVCAGGRGRREQHGGSRAEAGHRGLLSTLALPRPLPPAGPTPPRGYPGTGQNPRLERTFNRCPGLVSIPANHALPATREHDPVCNQWRRSHTGGGPAPHPA